MISEEDLAKNERDAAAVIENPKAFTAQIYDAARAIQELCASVRELQAAVAAKS